MKSQVRVLEAEVGKEHKIHEDYEQKMMLYKYIFRPF